MSYPGATVGDVVAVAWAAIGILAASLLGSLHYLGSRIDGLADSLGARIDALSARMDGLESSLNARIDALGVRIDAHVERHVS